MDVLRVSIDEAGDCYIVGSLPTGESVTVTAFYDMDGASNPALTSNSATELAHTGLYYWSLSGMTTSPTVAMSILWVMTSGSTSNTDWGVIYIGGYPDSIEHKVEEVDTVVDSILVDTGTTLPASLNMIAHNVDEVLIDTGTTLPATLTTIDGIVDDIVVDTAVIGIGVSLDGGAATIAGMITKLADDNGGVNFDAGTDSLEAIANGETTPPTVIQIREEIDNNSTKLSGIKGDTEDIKEAVENMPREQEEWNP